MKSQRTMTRRHGQNLEREPPRRKKSRLHSLLRKRSDFFSSLLERGKDLRRRGHLPN